MATKRDGDIRVSGKFKKAVPCPLNEEEVHEKEQRIRKNLTKIVNLKEDMKPFVDKIKALNEENGQLRIDAENATEEREVYVVNEFHFKKKKVIVKRFDTGEEVEKRDMTEEERQEEFSDLLGGGSREAAGEGGEGGAGDDEEPTN